VPVYDLPNGSLASTEYGVPGGIHAPNFRVDNPTSGKRRGRILFLPGLGGSTLASPFYEGLSDGSGGYLRPDLNADGWQTVQTPNVHQFFQGADPIFGIPNGDVVNDSGHGSRFLDKNLRYFDHIIDYCNLNYGDMPVIVAGMSWGAWWGLELALHRQAGVTGTDPYAVHGVYAHCPVNNWANAAAINVGPPGGTYGTSYYTGMSLTTTALNGLTIPGRVTWGWLDTYITWTPPPVDAMNMVANACVATGGSASVGQCVVGSTTADLNSNAAFLAGTGILNLGAGTPASSFPPASSGSPATACLGNIASSFYGSATIITATVTYTGIDTVNNNLTGVKSTADFLNRTMVMNPAVTVSAAVTSGGTVNGEGVAEGHTWSSIDTADCVAWFAALHAGSGWPKAY